MSAVTGSALAEALQRVILTRRQCDEHFRTTDRVGGPKTIEAMRASDDARWNYEALLSKTTRGVLIGHYLGLAIGVARHGNPWHRGGAS